MLFSSRQVVVEGVRSKGLGISSRESVMNNAINAVVESLEGRQLLCANLHVASHAFVAADAQAGEHVAMAINAGGQDFVDATTGQVWSADSGFVGGSASPAMYPVGNTENDLLISNQRAGAAFDYALPLEAGQYKVKLSFAEPVNQSAGQRMFDIFAEGQQVADDFDPYAQAGLRSMTTIESQTMTITDGQLNLSFAASKGNAVVSAIEVIYVGEAATGEETSPPPADPSNEATEVIIDDNSPGVINNGFVVGNLTTAGYNGGRYLSDGNAGKGQRSITYVSPQAVAGEAYKVSMWYHVLGSRSSNTPVDIYTSTGVVTVLVDQRSNGSQWFDLGSYQFDPAVGLKVVVRNGGTTAPVTVDAFKFTPTTAAPTQPTEVIIDDTNPGVTNNGFVAGINTTAGYNGGRYLSDGNAGKGQRSITYVSPQAVAGQTYKVSMWYHVAGSRSSNTPVDIYASTGVVTVLVDQRSNGSQWFDLGSYQFDPSVGLKVVVRNGGTTAPVTVDAFKFTPTSSTPTEPTEPTEVVIDDTNSGVTNNGFVPGINTTAGYNGGRYLSDGNAGKGQRSITYVSTQAVAGQAYKVSMWYHVAGSRSSNTPVDIYTSTGVVTVLVDQRFNGSRWFDLGSYQFDPAVGLKVVVRNGGTTAPVTVDAFRFTPVVPASIPASPTNLQVAPVSGNAVNLTWSDSSSNENHFLVERREAGGEWTFAGMVVANITKYHDEGLANAKTYEWRVRARGDAGVSAFSNVVSGTPGPAINFNGVTWSNRNSPSPQERVEALHAVVDGKLYVFGGFSGVNGPTTRSDVYNPATNTWTRIADMPERLTHVGVAVAGRDIYLASAYVGTGPGYQQQFSSVKTWKYNVDTNSWSAFVPLPAARASGGMVHLNGYLYYFGGSNNTSNRADRPEAWRFKLDGGTSWESIASMNNARTHMGYAVHDGKIWAVGGQKSYDQYLTAQSTLEFYDPQTNTWTVKAPMPRPLSHIGGTTFVMGTKLIVIGGEYDHLKPVNTIYAYDFISESWSTVGNLPFNSFSGVAVEIDGKIYHTTGSNGRSTYIGTPQVV